MIASLQRSQILERVLRTYYQRGVEPTYRQLLQEAALLLGASRYGKPLFAPRPAAPELIIEPEALTKNLEEIYADLDILFSDIREFGTQYVARYEAFLGDSQTLQTRCLKLSAQLDMLLAAETGNVLFYDTFHDMSHVDQTQTTAQIDTLLNQASLPTVLNSSRRISPGNISVISESLPPGGVRTGGAFSALFNALAGESFQAKLPEGSAYSAVILFSDLEVISHLEFDTTGPVVVGVESSLDNLTWNVLRSESVTGPTAWDILPTTTRYLRFTLSATQVGVRTISLGHADTRETATLISTAFTSPRTIHTLDFQLDATVPVGTNITSQISTDGTNWTPLLPGEVNVADLNMETLVFSASGDFVSDNTADSGALWQIVPTQPIATSGLPQPLSQGGELWRGIGQARVEGFTYDWGRLNNPYHLPDPADWQRGLAPIQSVYMMPVTGGTDGGGIPTTIFSKLKSFLLSGWQRGSDSWWGVAVQNADTQSALQDASNYRVQTWLYSDRDTLITEAGGGAYAIGNTGSTRDRYTSWALFVNKSRVAASDYTYPTAPIGGSNVRYSDVIEADAPAVWYRFADTNDTLLDSSTHGLNGSYHNSAQGFITHGVPGIPGESASKTTSFYWDGHSTDYGYATPPNGALSLTADWTLEMWVQDRGLPLPYYLIDKSGIQVWLGPESSESLAPTYVTLLPAGDSISTATLRVALPDTAWHHVAFTYTAATVRCYLDGVLVHTESRSLAADSASVATLLPVTRTAGLAVIDELARYTSALSLSRLQAHYAAGIGDRTTTGGDLSFALPLKAGWNQIELYIYQPPRSALPSNMKTANQFVCLLFKPDIFAFAPGSLATWSYTPLLPEYPVWADGSALQRTSEFALKWNTPLRQNNRWAWRISDTTGEVTQALLNYNPVSLASLTVDGVYRGDSPVFRLQYPTSVTPVQQIYYRADFMRNGNAEIPPVLRSYRLRVVQ